MRRIGVVTACSWIAAYVSLASAAKLLAIQRNRCRYTIRLTANFVICIVFALRKLFDLGLDYKRLCVHTQKKLSEKDM